MKLSFSTSGCLNFDVPEIIAMAKDVGFAGIEVRGFSDESRVTKTSPFHDDNLLETLAELSATLDIPCLSSGYVLGDRGERQGNIRGIRRYIDFASRIGVPYVRVMGDRDGNEPDAEIDNTVYETALQLTYYAEEKNVTLLIETAGVFTDTARLRDLLERVGSDNVAVLWDVHNTYRYSGESPETTVQNLGAYIKHTHIKDSSEEDGKLSYRMMGEGDLPITEAVMALRSIKYDGYISFEWMESYLPELWNAGIVFPQFVDYMGRFLGREETFSRLYENNQKTGKYVWQKEMLLDLTFPQVLDRIVEEFPDQYAFRYTTHDYVRTYRQFRDDVDEFARVLIGMGVKQGDHVAVWATNVPEWFISFWAAVKIGAVLVTVNTAYKIHEAEYLLRQSDTHTLIMIEGYRDSDYAGIIMSLCPELATHAIGRPLHARKLPFLRNIITVGFELPGCMRWEDTFELAGRVPVEEVYRRSAVINKHDVCNMQYTSGTTGFPKGVMLTHYNIINNGKAIGDCLDFSTADRLLIQVPMFHCFGMVLAMTAAVTHGATMSPIPAFSPTISLDCINKEKITAIHGVPTMFIALLGHADFEKTDFSHMRTGIMAGSPCPIKVMEDVIEKMNIPEICITYGQTEASPACTMSKTTDSIEARVNTVGGPIFGVEVKIVDTETGETLGNNMDGELCARGYNIMKGYYKMPAAAAAAIDEDGWLHTGDLAKRDEDGNYKITGRIKDMIIRGGENIYPKEIEDFIYTHPKVSDVQVIGVPDKDYGEEIMACIILKEGEEMDADELKAYVTSHMARHKTPRYVEFVDEFPMNAAGKILKYVMREEAVKKLSLQDAESIATA